MVTEIKNSMSSLSGSSDEAQGRLAIATAELNESREEIRRKTELIDELERKVTEQIRQQNEEAQKAMDEMMSTKEVRKISKVCLTGQLCLKVLSLEVQ